MLFAAWLSGCANIVAPSGGARDTDPPKILSVTPADSSLSIRPARIELRFDEYVQLGDLGALQISPLLPTPLTATAAGRRIIVRIPDTALQEATTYRIRFGPAIQDLHEANPFGDYAYTFSTGTYFDSLRLTGYAIHAGSGLPDSGATIVLYAGTADDTAVLRRKPLYTTRTDGSGAFSIEGLPPKAFRLYAIGDANANLTADGGERVGFLDRTVVPSMTPDSASAVLRTFIERPDSPQVGANTTVFGQRAGSGEPVGAPAFKAGTFSYAVAVDTADAKARVDLTKPLRIFFSSRVAAVNADRIFLSADSGGVTVETPVKPAVDTPGRRSATLIAVWKPDAYYTLRLLKGFARDTAGADAGPSRYRFRTKREEDYGKLAVRVPSKYAGPGFVLQVEREGDTVYSAPMTTDSTVRLVRLAPGAYTLRIIADANRNGRWDPGDLLLRRQPEVVFAHGAQVPVKAGWEVSADFSAFDPTRRDRPGTPASAPDARSR